MKVACTCGHKGCLKRHGYYVRTLRLNSERIRLRILRVKCQQCGRTHALLLSSIVPYSQLSLQDQYNILVHLDDRNGLEKILDENLLLDEREIRHVKRKYRQHWEQRLLSAGLTLAQEISEVILGCFSSYCRQFMQIRRCMNPLFQATT